MFKNRRFDLYLLKNTILSMLPALAVLVAMMAIISHFEIANKFTFEYADGPDALQRIYDRQVYNVKLHVDRADYLGYDYYLDDDMAGRYYYSFIDGKCIILLIDSKEDVILDYTVKGLIKSDSALYQYLLAQCASDMGIDVEQLQNAAYGYVISEVDYPELFYGIVQIVILIVICIIIITLLEGIYRIILPWKTPSVKAINGVANGKLVVKDLNKQLKECLLLKQKDILVTEKYLIAPSAFRTDVILIDHIEVLSKHMERKHGIFGSKDVYKLIISDSEDMFYEQEFENEQMIDEIIPLLEKKEAAY